MALLRSRTSLTPRVDANMVVRSVVNAAGGFSASSLPNRHFVRVLGGYLINTIRDYKQYAYREIIRTPFSPADRPINL